ncbi:MAG: CBS domain-containing protein [Gemmatimonadales bacterium]|nr:MAG: CBS domain-containing protein [Gemmatimonadales bacterium]
MVRSPPVSGIAYQFHAGGGMRVSEVMRTDVRTVEADASVGETVTLLADEHISGVPVLDRHGKLVGVVSNSDILEALAEHNDPEARESIFESTPVQDIMSTGPQVIGPQATVKEAAQRMLYLEVHRLFVEEEGRLLGVVSTTDLVRALAGTKV